jgi:hypothetical protein
MEIPMGQQEEQTMSEQYEQGPGPEVTEMQVPQQRAMTTEEAHDFLDNALPLMRKQGEYDKLMIEQLTNDALLNRRPIAQIPGLLGFELKVREIQTQQFLGNYTAQLSDQLKVQQEKEAVQKIEALKTGIAAQYQYDGTNAGAIAAFSRGEDVTTAAPIEIDIIANPSKRIVFNAADINYKSGYREVSLLPGYWVIKCGDNTLWSLTDQEYTERTK